MDTQWAYCSACDRQVEVVIRPREEVDPTSGRTGEEIVCLEVGHTCTGALCPITDVPPDEMREALRRTRADAPADPEED